MDGLTLTKEQISALWKFRNNIQDIIPEHHDDDTYLLKWLKARKYDAEKAEAMYRKSMLWRQHIGADSLLTDWTPPEVLQKHYAGGPGGFGKDGHPIWFDLASYMDFKGLLRSCKRGDIVRYEAYQIERARQTMKEQSEKLGKTIDQVIVIMDLSKLGLKHLTGPHLSVFNEIMEMTEANYPENLKACYIINAPRIFPLAFNLAKNFLAEETKQKIFVLGTDYLETLLKAVDKDQLPEAWGGNLPDSDQICLGGDIPESYYSQTGEGCELTGLTRTQVERGKQLRLNYRVSQPGSLLRWEFLTEKYDLEFGVFLVPASFTVREDQDVGEMHTLCPLQRVNSHLVPQDGAVQCPHTGTYVLIFNNKYSWLNSKVLHYKVELIEYSASPVKPLVASTRDIMDSMNNIIKQSEQSENNVDHCQEITDQLVDIDL